MKLVLEGSIEIIVPEGFGLELDLGLWDFVIYELQFRWIHILIRYRENFTTILQNSMGAGVNICQKTGK